MKETFELQKASKHDIPAIVECFNLSNVLFPVDQRPTLDADSCEAVFLKNENYIAKIEDKVCGWLAFNIEGDLCILTGLYTHKDFQRRGLGEILFQHLKCILSETSCKAIVCKALVNAPWSQNFYLKRDFTLFKTDEPANQKDLPMSLRTFIDREKHKTHSRILFQIL